MSKKPSIKSFRHLEGLNVNAVFSDCGNYRYLMEIKKGDNPSGKHICAIMLNPSIADENQADKSVQFLEKLIFEKPSPYFKDMETLIIVNLFAFIQTRKFQGNPEQAGPDNDQYLRQTIAKSDMVLIAWGKSCGYPQRQELVMNILHEYPEKPVFITKSHPSRGTYKDFIRPFYPKEKGP
jgi:hypothetical protein